jgi:hypothetical protein
MVLLRFGPSPRGVRFWATGGDTHISRQQKSGLAPTRSFDLFPKHREYIVRCPETQASPEDPLRLWWPPSAGRSPACGSAYSAGFLQGGGSSPPGADRSIPHIRAPASSANSCRAVYARPVFQPKQIQFSRRRGISWRGVTQAGPRRPSGRDPQAACNTLSLFRGRLTVPRRGRRQQWR